MLDPGHRHATVTYMGQVAAAELTQQLVGEVFACADDIARQIVAEATLANHPMHKILLHQGDETRQVFLMLDGLARAMLASEQGVLVFIDQYARGELFGDLQLGPGSVQEAEVVAATDLSLMQIDGHVLAGLGERHGSIGLALSRILFARLQRATISVYERTALSSTGRVYAELLRMGEACDYVLSPPPVVSDLALRVGTTRETASRCLSTLSRRGIITRGDGALRIIAPQRLEELVF